ncbi:MAG: M48 family metallopeptidase [Bacteroidota bacterium]
MMRLFIPILLLTCLAGSMAAQSDMTLLRAEGKIPKEYITPSKKKYKRQIEALEKKSINRRDKKSQKQFLLQSNFMIDDLLQSGLVLFNDSVTNYVNDVLQIIVEANPNIKRKEKLRVYTLRSPNVNAFATDQSIIFVTLGLLANLENEAQLAYVLSHEMVHIQERHTLDLFLETKEINRRKRNDKNILGESSFNARLLAKSMFSKQLEMEADEHGWDLFVNTNYSSQSLPNVFKMLFYSYLPFDDVEFPTDYFDEGTYILPQRYWKKEVDPITPFSDTEEELGTHPSAFKRLNRLEPKIREVAAAEDKENFLVSEERFRSIRKQARYELPLLHLESELLADALYNSYLVENLITSDFHTRKIMAKALYMQAKYEHEYESLNPTAINVEGASQRVHFLLDEMPTEEVVVLALRYNWKLYQENPKDKELAVITEDLFRIMVEYHQLEDFKHQYITAVDTTNIVVEPEKLDTTQEASKYDKIAAQQNDSNYWQFAFVPYIQDSSFVEGFNKGLKALKRKEKLEKYYSTRQGKVERYNDQKERSKGLYLGINRITVVNPFYLNLDGRRRDNNVRFIKSEEGQSEFRSTIKDVSKISKLRVNILDVVDLRSTDIQAFNDIRHLNSWFEQQINHLDLSLTPGYSQNTIDQIADRYNSDYFLWTGIISLRQKKRIVGDVVLSLLIPYYLPVGIYRMAKPSYDMMFYAILFDVKTGKREAIKFEYFDYKDTDTLVKAHLYDVFNQIKARKKKTSKRRK